MLASLVPLLLGGCSDDTRQPEAPAEELSVTDLAAMPLNLDELGSRHKSFTSSSASDLETNSERAKNASALERVGVEADAVEFGRISGYTRYFLAAPSPNEAQGVWLVGSRVELYMELSLAFADAYHHAALMERLKLTQVLSFEEDFDSGKVWNESSRSLLARVRESKPAPSTMIMGVTL